MPKTIIKCDWCGADISRYTSRIKRHNFCSRKCMDLFQSKSNNPDRYRDLKDFTNIGKHLSELNKEMNKTRMTPEVRAKLRQSRLGTGEGVTYTKLYGTHEHRVVAKRMLGRDLRADEVVHHIDGDKRNNSEKNLLILTRSEHAKLHSLIARYMKGRKNEEPSHDASS